MKRMTLYCGSTFPVLLGWLLGTAPTQAGVLWTAEWQTDKPTIVSDHGSNEMLLAPAPLANGEGTASILAAQFTMKAPFVGSSDSFTSQNYALNLVVTDAASHAAATLVFSGELTGPVTATGSQITNTFHPDHAGYVLDLSDNHYEVTIGPFEPDGNGTAVGSLRALIAATGPVATEPPPTQPPPAIATPEPSTLVLAGVGLACGAWRGWRRRPKA